MTSNKDFFDSLVGFEYDFYGVDNNTFCIGVEGRRCAFEAQEDPEDGWRSHLATVEVSTTDHVYFQKSLGRVTLEFYQNYFFDGYVIRDVVTGHEWLKFGTDNTDDYYPLFTFAYRAMMTPFMGAETQRCGCQECEKRASESLGESY